MTFERIIQLERMANLWPDDPYKKELLEAIKFLMDTIADMHESLKHTTHDHEDPALGGIFVPRSYACPKCLSERPELHALRESLAMRRE